MGSKEKYELRFTILKLRRYRMKLRAALEKIRKGGDRK